MGTETPSEVTHLFPDESQMPRSADGSEPIRGGSVGFNRILGTFTERSQKDTKPFADLFVINGMTIFRNVYKEDMSDAQLKDAWEKDVELFALYLGAYRVTLAGGNDPEDQSEVLIYLPTYDRLPKAVRMEHDGTKLATQLKRYQMFYNRYKQNAGVMIDEPGVRVVLIAVGSKDYPHREVDRYIMREPNYQHARHTRHILLITHVLLDYFLSVRLPSIVVWESYTAKFRQKSEFGLRLDPCGFIPFNSLMFGLFGDKLLVKCVLDVKGKRFVRKTAEEFKFPMRSETFMAQKLSSLSNVPVAELSHYNFV